MGGYPAANPPSAPARSSGRWPVRLLLFGVVALLAAAGGFLVFSVNEARILVQRFGYYTIAGTFVWAVIAWTRCFPGWWCSWRHLTRREIWSTTGFILGLTLVAVITVPYTYKVLYDEFVLQATAWSMHDARIVGAMVRGYDIGGVFTTLQTYLDKRPIFFAYLISLLHDLTGPRTANAFALNTALMPVALGLVYLFARRLVPHLASLAAVCAFGAFTLLAQNATGSGMEMLNLVMLLLVMHLGAWYLEQPDDARLTAFILGAVLLAQTRYESGLYVAPAALVVLEGWWRSRRLILPAAAMLAPALLIPYALHNTYLSGSPLLWELREGEATRFSPVYLTDNLIHAFRFFFSFSGKLTNSWWLGLAGLPAFGWALWAACRHAKRWRLVSATTMSLVIFGAAIAANLGLLMFYYWGQLDDSIVSRLSLPFSALCALCIAWAVVKFPARWQNRVAQIAMGGALLSYLTSGLLANGTHWSLNLQAREIAWELAVVQQQPPKPRLILTNKSALIWLTNEISSIQIVRARQRIDAIRYHLAQHTFSEVLVMQNYRPVGPEGGFQLDPLDRLPDAFVLEPVLERRFGTHIARISRVADLLPTGNAANDGAPSS
jgi:hypothetical protein